MNIRSLTRGDGVVIGAAVVLFIASFLDIYSLDNAPDGISIPSAWSSGPLLLSVFLAGIIGAALVVVSRALPAQRKVAGLELGQFGAAFAVFAAWSALGNVFDPMGGVDNVGSVSDNGVSAGTGLILGLIAALVMAAAAVATPLVPALQAPLIPAPKPPAPQPYGAPPQGGYGYPGAQPYGGRPQQGQQPFGGQPQQGQQPPQAPAAGFSPFWFAVPQPRPLYAEDGSPTPIAELSPGVWYLAVDQRGPGLLTELQDGRRGVLQDTSNIQRG
ncbi:DUF5336 domain-containing protein [Streptomyces echinoruber]|uniref:Uncharacterized protein n=1 Tax=Streptomyces echinoruber TaxID=68898 RepID=A0A918V871_9ACTN|nr:DUF5336 domain-containing protein [Streptomyces echinoruber]GGZ74664.1 hypothetical protein GCM10010389_10450 [Streptomyces echinoruber]